MKQRDTTCVWAAAATEDASPLIVAFFSVAASVLFLLQRMRRRHKQTMHLAPKIKHVRFNRAKGYSVCAH